VLQRTLAFSVVSTALLTALGLGKWLTELLLHNVGLPHGLWADMLVSFVVVAAFATIQKPLLARADALVFRRWHEAAQRLRDFVEAAHLTTEPALLQERFAAAVDAFTESQGSALYEATQEGGLRQVQATLPGAPRELDANDPLSIALRNGARRVDLTRMPASAASGAAEWGFAMRVRGRISGALLVGPRPEQVAYRAEEISQLEDSTRRIGLDLESLRVAELERSQANLLVELAELKRLRVPSIGA